MTDSETNACFACDKPLVSVFMGTFPDQAAYERYFQLEPNGDDPEGSLICQFWRDLGVAWFDGDNEECSGFVGDPIPAIDLLGRDWSYIDSIRESVLATSAQLQIDTANCLLLLYEFNYPVQRPFLSRFLAFIGVFQYPIT